MSNSGQQPNLRYAAAVLGVGVVLAVVLIGTGTSAFGGLLILAVAVVLALLLATGRLR
jgi:hypothetical protein